jgi:hypothetical protein
VTLLNKPSANLCPPCLWRFIFWLLFTKEKRSSFLLLPGWNPVNQTSFNFSRDARFVHDLEILKLQSPDFGPAVDYPVPQSIPRLYWYTWLNPGYGGLGWLHQFRLGWTSVHPSYWTSCSQKGWVKKVFCSPFNSLIFFHLVPPLLTQLPHFPTYPAHFAMAKPIPLLNSTYNSWENLYLFLVKVFKLYVV